MPNRRTGIGFMIRTDLTAAEAEIRRVLFRNHGELKASARDFGIERRTMLRYVHRFRLWRFVWSLRRVGRRLSAPDEIKRALERTWTK